MLVAVPFLSKGHCPNCIMFQEILVKTEDFPLILNENITSLQDSVPKIEPLPSIHEIFNSQEIVTSNMANHLEGLTSHYDEMAAALRDKESGEEISEEDLQGLFVYLPCQSFNH